VNRGKQQNCLSTAWWNRLGRITSQIWKEGESCCFRNCWHFRVSWHDRSKPADPTRSTCHFSTG